MYVYIYICIYIYRYTYIYIYIYIKTRWRRTTSTVAGGPDGRRTAYLDGLPKSRCTASSVFDECIAVLATLVGGSSLRSPPARVR